MISGQKIYNLMTKILAKIGINSSAKIYKKINIDTILSYTLELDHSILKGNIVERSA